MNDFDNFDFSEELKNFKKDKAPEAINVLYIDDELNNLSGFKANFRRDFNVFTAPSAAEARKIMKDTKMHIIISDQRMPDETGVQFFNSIKEEYPDPIRILLTGYADIEAVIGAINKGQVYRYITKPWDENELKITIKNAYEVFALREENKELMKSLIQSNKQLEFMLRQRLLS